METNDSTLWVNTFDVLDELRSAPEAWDSIARANTKLNRSGTKSKKIANETEALTETAEIIGDNDLQGGKATIIGLGPTASQATFGMVAVEGRYESFSVYNPDTDDPGRVRPFESIDDFVFSGGEPMAVLTNEITGMYYLVKLRDIVDCTIVD